MNIINSFVIESERFYYYDITKVMEEHEKLKRLPISLKIVLEASLRKAKDSIEFEKIINIFSNRMGSKIEVLVSKVVLEEYSSTCVFSHLASLRDVKTSINPKLPIDLILSPNFEEENKEKNSFFKWVINSFSNTRVCFKDKKSFKDINLEVLSTVLHVEKKDEEYYLYPETVLGLNSFGVLGYHVNEIELKRAILGDTISIDLPKVVGINIKNDLKEDEFSFTVFKALSKKLKEYDLRGKIVEFYGSGLKYISLEERFSLFKMTSDFGALSLFFSIDEKTIDYFNITRGNKDFGHLIQKYLELQRMLPCEKQELDYDDNIDIEISSLEKVQKDEELFYLSFDQINENIFKEDTFWQNIEFQDSLNYPWDENSTFIQALKIFDKFDLDKIEIKDASILALFEDSISSEMISSLSQISLYSPTSKYLESKGIRSFEYGTFKDRVMNPHVMIRGLFDSKDIHNLMVSKEGGYTMDYDTNEIIPIFKKAYRFEEKNKDFVIFAGDNYGEGKSRDWAAKGMRVLGIKAIIAKSFGEDYRQDLIKYGVLPLEFIDDDIDTLKLKGREEISILTEEIKEDSKIDATILKNGINIKIELKCRLDNQVEVEYYKNGGLYPYLLKKSFI